MLPNYKNAAVPPEKLTHYLLSKSHAIGRFKAVFFNQHGFTEGNYIELEKALISVAQTGTISSTLKSPYGTKYVIDGSIETPLGSNVGLRTIWIIKKSSSDPIFVTAFPK